jgi:hypothetical protein
MPYRLQLEFNLYRPVPSGRQWIQPRWSCRRFTFEVARRCYRASQCSAPENDQYMTSDAASFQFPMNGGAESICTAVESMPVVTAINSSLPLGLSPRASSPSRSYNFSQWNRTSRSS